MKNNWLMKVVKINPRPGVEFSASENMEFQFAYIAQQCSMKLEVHEVRNLYFELVILGVSSDNAMKYIRHWLVDIGLPAQFFKLISSLEKSPKLDVTALATIIHKASGLSKFDSDFVVPFKYQDRYFYLVDADSQEIEKIEQNIKTELQKADDSRFTRVSMHHTKNAFIGEGAESRSLRIYILSKPLSSDQKNILGDDFLDQIANQIHTNLPSGTSTISELRNFIDGLARPLLMHLRAPELVQKYYEGWRRAQDEAGIFFFGENNNQLTVGFPSGFQNDVFSFQKVLKRYPGVLSRFYVNQVGDSKNPTHVLTLYFEQNVDHDIIEKIKSELRLSTLIPETDLMSFYTQPNPVARSLNEVYFLEAAVSFLSQFLVENNARLESLLKELTDAQQLNHKFDISELKSLLKEGRFQAGNIRDVFLKHPELIRCHLDCLNNSLGVAPEVPLSQLGALFNKIDPLPTDEKLILNTLFKFIVAIRKTNFLDENKQALAFELEPWVLKGHDYPKLPHVIRFVYTKFSTAVHLQFGPLGRGGIRLLVSRNLEEASNKFRKLLQEVYRLAFDQDKKNKDIDEFGAKGISAVTLGASPEISFKQTIKGMLDLAMQSPKHSVIEFGPDENVVPQFCDWVARASKDLGYQYWKTLISGKSAYWGGIGHKEYGVTSKGVYAHIKAWAEENGYDMKKLTAVHTGGTKGDLGSNQILESEYNIIGIVDGPALVYDPNGINREELTRLIDAEQDLDKFSQTMLSKDGNLIMANSNEYEIKINGADSTQSKTGTAWQNDLIFELAADILLPGGGRPSTINRDNVHRLLDKNGKPRYKAIFEGANIFITKDAYPIIEAMGIKIIPGPSANKGGVITSAYEVLVGYVLNDKSFIEEMCVRDKGIPKFRKDYIASVLGIVNARSRQEYASLRRMVLSDQSGKLTETQASDILSQSILDQTYQIMNNYQDWITPELEALAVGWYTPSALIEKVGIKTILTELPREEKLIPMVAKVLASQYHYRYGAGSAEGFQKYLADIKNGTEKFPSTDEILNTPIKDLIGVPQP
jgi:glutamate dehydrogenase